MKFFSEKTLLMHIWETDYFLNTHNLDMMNTLNNNMNLAFYENNINAPTGNGNYNNAFAPNNSMALVLVMEGPTPGKFVDIYWTFDS